MPFRQHMQQVAVRALAEFPAEPAAGIYTVTFRIDSVDQDPRFPYLAIGYNTESEVGVNRSAISIRSAIREFVDMTSLFVGVSNTGAACTPTSAAAESRSR